MDPLDASSYPVYSGQRPRGLTQLCWLMLLGWEPVDGFLPEEVDVSEASCQRSLEDALKSSLRSAAGGSSCILTPVV